MTTVFRLIDRSEPTLISPITGRVSK